MDNVHVILFPTDFSAASESALKVASSLAAESDALLVIAHVADDSTAALAGYAGFAFVPELPDEIATAAESLLRSVKPTDTKVRHRHRLLHGPPVESLLELANSEKADLIVLGSHGRTGLARLLMGSVAEGIVRRAPCPVLTVRSHADEDAGPSKEQPDASEEQAAEAETGPRGKRPATKPSLH